MGQKTGRGYRSRLFEDEVRLVLACEITLEHVMESGVAIYLFWVLDLDVVRYWHMWSTYKSTIEHL